MSDTPPPANPSRPPSLWRWLTSEVLSSFRGLLAAVQFLAVSPPLIRRPFTPPELGQAVGFFPLVGLLLGTLLVGANYLLSFTFPSYVRTALVLTLWVVLTGALHLDGFLDACDGLLGGTTPESRLQIMRDERVGAFALAGGILLLMLKFTALSAMTDLTTPLLLAPTLGRWGMALAVVAFPYARAQGLGRAMKDHASWKQATLGTGFALFTAWFAAHWLGLIAVAVAAATLWGGVRFALRRIPGLTGDIYGALGEIIEVVVLLALCQF